ncbi:Ribosomal large subunit pseudouridine synthase A [Symmachiella macrocystis]|uniref:Ribosomal large subunit pseudouridine synthase A n=1 Tax=Symmachiella macrocystis TaxID=2527985 RepID=A0A5C6BQH4_9PLAN|nr:RluA family pseudouridine synthase [Symmachiella macrocystis]TWU14453.1 Ribosomal large subunit pseudouridine synthase A [Symmachiella macrocystis]
MPHYSDKAPVDMILSIIQNSTDALVCPPEVNMAPLEILYSDNHCLAVAKPAKLLTAGDRTGDDTLLERSKEYVKQKYAKPGNVYLGIVQRLDRPTSGVVLFARTSKAAARLTKQFRDRTIEKTYLAIVEGNSGPGDAELVDWLKKDEARNIVSVAEPGTAGAKESRLRYRVLKCSGGRRLLEVRPLTGRSHQIRVQLSSRKMPIVGDRKYGARVGLGGKIALHAASLTFEHPTRREMMTITAELPDYFNELLDAGGA